MQIIEIDTTSPDISVCFYENDEPNGDSFRVFKFEAQAEDYAFELKKKYPQAVLVTH